MKRHIKIKTTPIIYHVDFWRKKKYRIQERKSQIIIPNHEEKEVLKRIILVKCVSGLKQLSKKGQGIWTYWIHLPIVHGEEAVIRPSPFSGWSSFCSEWSLPRGIEQTGSLLEARKTLQITKKTQFVLPLRQWLTKFERNNSL